MVFSSISGVAFGVGISFKGDLQIKGESGARGCATERTASNIPSRFIFTWPRAHAGFPFIQLNKLAGSVAFTPNPLAVTAAKLDVEGRLLNTNISALMVRSIANPDHPLSEATSTLPCVHFFA